MIKYSPIIISGMHRSGSTLLSRILENQGLYMGRSKDINNESIFFQNINQWIMSINGSDWDNPKSFQKLESVQKELLKNHLISYINSRYNYTYFSRKNFFINKKFEDIENLKWGWKDPRNTFTLQIWISIFPNIKVINICRHPIDVINSLLKRQKKLKIIDLKFKNKIFNNIKKYFVVHRSSILSSLNLNNIDDVISLYDKYLLESNINSELFNNNIFNVQFENILENPYVEIEKILSFCNMRIKKDKLNKILQTINLNRAYAYKRSNETTITYKKLNEIIKKTNY